MRRSTRRFLGNTFLIIFSLPILTAMFESETQKKSKQQEQ
jgi:hypothetical protein